jgi:hypothetical protein
VTLSTLIAVGKSYPVREILDFARSLIGTPEGTEVATWDKRSEPDGVRWIGNPCGIGLPAWLIVKYGIDGPFPLHQHDRFCSVELGGEWNTTQEDIDAHAADIATDPQENGWATTVVDFDTSYSYRGDNGESCSDLHARLVFELGQWLDAKGLPWKWHNEYTGEWFDRYDGLESFGDFHRASGADEWFRGRVLPAIDGQA